MLFNPATSTTLNTCRTRLGSFGVAAILVLIGSEGRADDPPKPEATPLPAFTIKGVEPRAFDADSPLAEGWPAATKPGMIEVKKFPAYRGAVASAKDASMGSDNILFFSLFNHITKSDVAMTAPVVNEFDPAMLAEPGAKGDVEMEFVYRTPTTGTVGRGVGAVMVEDRPAGSFVCLGIQGEMDPEKLRLAVKTLTDWLEEHEAEWVASGNPRRLGYHAPMVDQDKRWWEVQIPVTPVAPAE